MTLVNVMFHAFQLDVGQLFQRAGCKAPICCATTKEADTTPDPPGTQQPEDVVNETMTDSDSTI